MVTKRVAELALSSLFGSLIFMTVAGFLTMTGSFFAILYVVSSSAAFMYSLTALSVGVGASAGGLLGLICWGLVCSKPIKKESCYSYDSSFNPDSDSDSEYNSSIGYGFNSDSIKL